MIIHLIVCEKIKDVVDKIIYVIYIHVYIPNTLTLTVLPNSVIICSKILKRILYHQQLSMNSVNIQ